MSVCVSEVLMFLFILVFLDQNEIVIIFSDNLIFNYDFFDTTTVE